MRTGRAKDVSRAEGRSRRLDITMKSRLCPLSRARAGVREPEIEISAPLDRLVKRCRRRIPTNVFKMPTI